MWSIEEGFEENYRLSDQLEKAKVALAEIQSRRTAYIENSIRNAGPIIHSTHTIERKRLDKEFADAKAECAAISTAMTANTKRVD